MSALEKCTSQRRGRSNLLFVALVGLGRESQIVLATAVVAPLAFLG